MKMKKIDCQSAQHAERSQQGDNSEVLPHGRNKRKGSIPTRPVNAPPLTSTSHAGCNIWFTDDNRRAERDAPQGASPTDPRTVRERYNCIIMFFNDWYECFEEPSLFATSHICSPGFLHTDVCVFFLHQDSWPWPHLGKNQTHSQVSLQSLTHRSPKCMSLGYGMEPVYSERIAPWTSRCTKGGTLTKPSYKSPITKVSFGCRVHIYSISVEVEHPSHHWCVAVVIYRCIPLTSPQFSLLYANNSFNGSKSFVFTHLWSSIVPRPGSTPVVSSFGYW